MGHLLPFLRILRERRTPPERFYRLLLVLVSRFVGDAAQGRSELLSRSARRPCPEHQSLRHPSGTYFEHGSGYQVPSLTIVRTSGTDPVRQFALSIQYSSLKSEAFEEFTNVFV